MLDSLTIGNSDVGSKTGASMERRLSHLQLLEAQSIHILREVASEFERPVMLYSIGKDSSVMLRLAQKAFYPGPIPFPLLHIDTGFKFREMLAFRDETARQVGAELLVWRNEPAIAAGTNPIELDTKRCCGLLKTQALLDGLRHYRFDAAFGGARRDEEKSRAKERIYSFRDSAGQWDPKNQRPELWNLYNARIHPGESIRVFPLSNWTEMDVWQYIHEERIPVVDLYFARERPMFVRGDVLLPIEQEFMALARRKTADGEVPSAFTGLQPVHGGHPLRCGDDSGHYRRADLVSLVRTRQSRNRSRSGRFDGSQEAGGLLLDGDADPPRHSDRAISIPGA